MQVLFGALINWVIYKTSKEYKKGHQAYHWTKAFTTHRKTKTSKSSYIKVQARRLRGDDRIVSN